jgi:hypothetical protein
MMNIKIELLYYKLYQLNMSLLNSKTKEDIKNLFLAITKSKMLSNGYQFSLNTLLDWVGAFTEIKESELDEKIKNKKLNRININAREIYFYKARLFEFNEEIIKDKIYDVKISTKLLNSDKIIEKKVYGENIHKYNDEYYVTNNYNFTYGKDYIIEKSKDKKYDGKREQHIPDDVFMNHRTFKKFCMKTEYPLSDLVRDYYVDLEEDYIKSLGSTLEENAVLLEKINETTDQLELKNKQILKIEIERDDQIIEIYKLRKQNKKNSKSDDCTVNKDTFNQSGNPLYMNYRYMCEMTMTKVPLLLVDDKYVNSKYKESKSKPKKPKKKNKEAKLSAEDVLLGYNSDHESDDENAADEPLTSNAIQNHDLLEYDQSYKSYDIYDIKDSDEPYYLKIHAFGSKVEPAPELYHKIGEVEILDKKHYNAIVAKLSDNDIGKTNLKNIFKLPYSSIEDACITTLNERLYEIIKTQ